MGNYEMVCSAPVDYQECFGLIGRYKEFRVGIIADHCIIGFIFERINYPRNDFFMNCFNQEEMESVQL